RGLRALRRSERPPPRVLPALLRRGPRAPPGAHPALLRAVRPARRAGLVERALLARRLSPGRPDAPRSGHRLQRPADPEEHLGVLLLRVPCAASVRRAGAIWRCGRPVEQLALLERFLPRSPAR